LSSEKALGRVREQRLLTGELHVRDALDREGNPTLRESAGDVDVDREHAEIEHVHAFDEGPAQRAAAADETKADGAIADAPRGTAEDERFVRCRYPK
jgi:hypothetical protein